MNRFQALLILQIFLSGFLWGGGNKETVGVEEELRVLDVPKKSWKIGFTILEGSSLDLMDRTSYTSALQLFSDSVQEHVLTPGEKDSIREFIIGTELRRLNGELLTLLDSFDREFLLDETNNSSENRKSKNEELLELRNQIELLLSADKNSVSVPDSLPLEIIYPPGDLPLFDRNSNSVGGKERTLDKEDLDFLITGSVISFDNRRTVEIEVLSAYEPGLSSVRWFQHLNEGAAVLPDESMAKNLKTFLLGKPWSALEISVSPGNTEIILDDEVIGRGYVELNDINPGEYRLILKAPGYYSREEILFLEPFDKRVIDLVLDHPDRVLALITSTPSGADIYRASQWIGKTPFSVSVPDIPLSLELSLEGYNRKTVSLSPLSPGEIHVDLSLDLEDEKNEFTKARSQFYRSTGWFSLSLAAPVVLSGIYQNYAYQYNGHVSDGDLESAEEALKGYQISRGLFWGSIGISSALLINVFFQLRDYIKAGEAVVE